MTNPPFKIDVSPRISRLPPYLFGRIKKMKFDKRRWITFRRRIAGSGIL